MAAFPGQNGKIVFASEQHCPLGTNANPGNPNGCGEQIYTMNPDGTGQTRLTFNHAIERFPAWSPDGTKIAFSSGRDCSGRVMWLPGQPCSFEIYVMNADGSNQTRLTNDSANSSQNPVWSPDGNHIAFWKIPNAAPGPSGPINEQIWTMDPNGGNQKKISDGTAPDLAPGWSPNPSTPPPGGVSGEWIAFTRLRLNGMMQLVDSNTFLMKPDGTSVMGPLGAGMGVAGDIAPRWSPDQSTLVFMSARQCGLTAPVIFPPAFGTGVNRCNLEVWSMPVTQSSGAISAGTPKRLTNTFVQGCANDGSSNIRCASNYLPNFSPDGKKIVFYSDRIPGNPTDRGDDAIYVMNADGSNQTPLTSDHQGPNKANSNDGDWQALPIPPSSPSPPAPPLLPPPGPAAPGCKIVLPYHFHVHQNNGRVKELEVFVNGKLVRTIHSRRIKMLTITPPSTPDFKVRIVAFTTKHKRVVSVRQYHFCFKGPPKTVVHHHHHHH